MSELIKEYKTYRTYQLISCATRFYFLCTKNSSVFLGRKNADNRSKNILSNTKQKNIMKTFKTLFVALFISTFFIACEAETINEEVSVELEDNQMMTGEEDIEDGARQDD